MKMKYMAVLVSGLFVSSYAMADALIQSVSLGATAQLGVVSLTPTSVVSATAPLTTQTAAVDAAGNPTVTLLSGVLGQSSTQVPAAVSVSGMGSASATTIQTALAYSAIPVIAPGAVLATIPSVPSSGGGSSDPVTP